MKRPISYVWDDCLKVYFRSPQHTDSKDSTPSEPNVLFVPILPYQAANKVFEDGPYETKNKSEKNYEKNT